MSSSKSSEVIVFLLMERIGTAQLKRHVLIVLIIFYHDLRSGK